MGDADDDIDNTFRHLCLKGKLQSLLGDKARTEAVRDAVVRNGAIVVRAYNFIKLYLLQLYESATGEDGDGKKKETLAFDAAAVVAAWPTDLKHGFMADVYTVVSASDRVGGRQAAVTEQRTRMPSAYDSFVAEGVLSADAPSITNLTYVKTYSAIEMATAYSNNIVFHYAGYIGRVCLKLFRKRMLELLPHAKWEEVPAGERRRMELGFKRIKAAFMNGTVPDVDVDLAFLYHEYVGVVGPRRPPGNGAWYIGHRMSREPLLYLAHMVKMNRLLEAADCKLLGPLCLRRDLIPKYARFDTCALIDVLVGTSDDMPDIAARLRFTHVDGHGEQTWDLKPKATKMDLKQTPAKALDPVRFPEAVLEDPELTGKFKTALWKTLTHLGWDCCRTPTEYKGLVFNGMIDTDGYAISAHYVERDAWGKSSFAKPKAPKKTAEEKKAEKAAEFEDLRTMPQADRRPLLNGKRFQLLFCDPGKDDILYIGDGSRRPNRKGKALAIRYTKSQRRAETGLKRRTEQRARRLRREIPEKFAPTFERYIDAERSLIETPSNTCFLGRFKAYLAARRVAETCLVPFNLELGWRADRYNAYTRRKSSEAKFWARVDKTFPLLPGRERIIIFGDWGRRPNLRGSAPTPGIGIRRGCPFRTLTSGEARTSGTCNCCGQWGPMATPFTVQRVKGGEVRNFGVHNLLRCPNEQCASRLWQRNANGMLNIRINALHALQHGCDHPRFRLQAI